MYKKRKALKGTLRSLPGAAYEAEPIEAKVRKIFNSNEPITDATQLVYTERKDGVIPDYDIRTDRMEHAVEAMDAASRANLAKREMRSGERTFDTMSDADQAKFMEKFPNAKPKKGGKSGD